MGEEWFQQGDKEKSLGLAISPMMDRTKPNIPRGQVGFIDYIVKPLFENWMKLFKITNVCLNNLSKQRKSKPITLNEPISLNHPNNSEFHSIIVTKKNNKKKRNKKNSKK